MYFLETVSDVKAYELLKVICPLDRDLKLDDPFGAFENSRLMTESALLITLPYLRFNITHQFEM